MKENQLAKASNKLTYSSEQVALIKSQIAPKATDDELKLFLYQCQRTGLDALSRQIYAIHRKSGNTEKMTIQTSIDGFRVIAERSGDYGGQSEPVFVEENGKLICAKVSVFRFRGDVRYEAAVGVAYWDEYVVTKDEWVNGQKTGKKIATDMWAKMPHTMLAKVAEAIALRKAYPQDLSGLYTGDEMEQATEDIKHEEVKDVLNGIEPDTSGASTIGTAVKPLLSNIGFKKLCERVKNGDTKAYYAAIETFTLESRQRSVLDDYFNELKNPGNNLKAAS